MKKKFHSMRKAGVENLAEKSDNVSVIAEIEKIIQPHLSKINIPADGDYRREAREWQYEKYEKKKKGKKNKFQSPDI